MILEIDNVELSFSGKKILNGIYLKAETGKVTGILGSNGCGKTCLLNIIFGSLQPKYKLIRLNGQAVMRPLYQTKHVAFLPQHSLIPKNLKISTVFKLLKVDWFVFIERFPNFSFFKDTSINILSGGEQRIIETYLILGSPKKIVLLDEPFSNIAPLDVAKFKELIQIEKKTKAIIVTDHYFQDVIETSDDLYLLKNGCTKYINRLEELEDYQYLKVGMLTDKFWTFTNGNASNYTAFANKSALILESPKLTGNGQFFLTWNLNPTNNLGIDIEWFRNGNDVLGNFLGHI